jgi:CRP-like cAMP-binding protein
MAKTKGQDLPSEIYRTAIDLAKLEHHLGVVSRCLGVLALRLAPTRPKTDASRVAILGACGFDRNEIAEMLSISRQTASNRLAEWKASLK